MLAKYEAKLLAEAFRGLLSKVGGGTENPIHKILRKAKPRVKKETPKYRDFGDKLRLISSYTNPTDYGRPRTFLGG